MMSRMKPIVEIIFPDETEEDEREEQEDSKNIDKKQTKLETREMFINSQNQLLKGIKFSYGKTRLLYNLFPTVVWSEISLFIPEEFFQLCEEFQLPYHYALSISVKNPASKLPYHYA